ETTHQLAETAKTVHELLADFRQVTGNAQTQGQLRDAAAQLDATTQRINSLAGSLGGRSSVYGVDAGATPIPAGSPPPATGPPPARRPALGTGFISGSIRFSELAPTRGRPNRTPVLGSDRGPQTDVNLTLLPHAPASLFLGANDIGGFTTANFALIAHRNRLDYGGGLLYSRLGILARVEGRRTDFETRLYDPRHPTLDAYAGVRILPQIDLFAGYRDLLYPERRAVFGLQFSP
ncbi:MAG: hypothetical protein ACREM8_02605, partial [Vulcanimicrobiaceae bacterium]